MGGICPAGNLSVGPCGWQWLLTMAIYPYGHSSFKWASSTIYVTPGTANCFFLLPFGRIWALYCPSLFYLNMAHSFVNWFSLNSPQQHVPSVFCSSLTNTVSNDSLLWRFYTSSQHWLRLTGHFFIALLDTFVILNNRLQFLFLYTF